MRVLDAAGKSDQVLPHPQPLAACGRELPVGRGGRVYRQSVDIPEARSLDAKLERGQEREGGLPPFGLQLEGDEAPCVGEDADGDVVVRVVLQGRVVYLGYLRVGGEAGRDQPRVLA